LKKGPLEVPPRISKQGIAVCAEGFMVQARSPNRGQWEPWILQPVCRHG